MHLTSRSVLGLDPLREPKDPNVERTRRHKLMDAVVMSVTQLISSTHCWKEIGVLPTQTRLAEAPLPPRIFSYAEKNRVFLSGQRRPSLSWIGLPRLALRHIVVARSLRQGHDIASALECCHLRHRIGQPWGRMLIPVWV